MDHSFHCMSIEAQAVGRSGHSTTLNVGREFRHDCLLSLDLGRSGRGNVVVKVHMAEKKTGVATLTCRGMELLHKELSLTALVGDFGQDRTYVRQQG